ncbi:MAG: methionine ABC transporter permease [Bacillota bacterium]|nr:methionine ABC transporter permease [Bacillota bacterium]
MDRILKIVLPALPETLLMVAVASLFGLVFGLPLAILLYVSQKGSLKENQKLYSFLDGLINIFRSLPFIVLIFILTPLTLLIAKKRIGLGAAMVPLSISAIPFLARLIEGNLNDVDLGIIEAAQAMGADTKTIVTKVLLREALSPIIASLTMTIIALVGQSAIVGSIGGGGLGDVALRYGYQRNEVDILWAACLLIILIVQVVQVSGNILVKKLDKRNK